MLRTLIAVTLLGTAPPAGVAAALLVSQDADEAVKMLPIDTEIQVNGTDVACTGIGESRLEPRWLSYPQRIEFSNARNEYLVGGVAWVRDRKGATRVKVGCEGPWILMRLPKAQYRLDGWLADAPEARRSATFNAGGAGVARLVLQFQNQ